MESFDPEDTCILFKDEVSDWLQMIAASSLNIKGNKA